MLCFLEVFRVRARDTSLERREHSFLDLTFTKLLQCPGNHTYINKRKQALPERNCISTVSEKAGRVSSDIQGPNTRYIWVEGKILPESRNKNV